MWEADWPMLTRPDVLNSVPRCGPDSDRNVWSRGSSSAIWGRDIADRIIRLPSEWPMKLHTTTDRHTLSHRQHQHQRQQRWFYTARRRKASNEFTHPFNGPLSGTTRVSRYQNGKINVDFTEAKRQWVAVASAGPYASLHLAPDLQPCQHPTTQVFTGQMPFLLPTQQRQSTEGTNALCMLIQKVEWFWFKTEFND